MSEEFKEWHKNQVRYLEGLKKRLENQLKKCKDELKREREAIKRYK